MNGKTFFKKEDLPMLNQYVFTELNKLEEDKLVLWNQRGVLLTELGNHFVRNVCRAFDLHLLRTQREVAGPTFSRAI